MPITVLPNSNRATVQRGEGVDQPVLFLIKYNAGDGEVQWIRAVFYDQIEILTE